MLVGAVFGTVMAFLIQLPIVGLFWFVLGGAIAVVCHDRLVPKSVNLGSGTLVGFATGFAMSLLLAATTGMMTGVKTLEFTIAVTTFPVIICTLSTVSGFVTALCIRYLR